MMTIRLSVLIIGVSLPNLSASAQSSTAIVEEIAGNPPGIEFMDYVEPGKVIQLGSADSIVLSYLNSCVREAIRGGAVKVGADQSESLAGSTVIERTKVDCDAGRMMGAAGQTNDAASLVIRGEQQLAIRPAPEPEFTIYGTSPIFELHGSGRLVIARLDKTGEYIDLMIEPDRLTRGVFLDFARDGRSLAAGGAYGVRWNRRLTVFKIDAAAKPGPTPIVGRLVRLVAAN